MSYLKRIDAQKLEVKEGGGCFSIFGFPFFAAGIFLFLGAFKLIPFENAAEVPEWSYAVLFFMGLVFTLVGGGLMFGRTWKTIDLRKGCIIKTTGTILPFLSSKNEESYLADYSTLVIRYDSGDSDTPETYPISLLSKASGRDFLLLNAHQYQEAIQHAEELAGFIHFPIEDRTSDHTKVFEPGKVWGTFKEFTRGSGEKDDFTMPLNMKSRIVQGNAGLEIFIPGPEIKITVLFPLGILLLLTVSFGPSFLEFFEKTHTPKIVQYFVAGFFVLLFLIPNVYSLIYKLAGSKRNGTRISVDRTGLIMEERSGWNTRKTRILFSEISDLDYSTVSALTDSTKNDMSARFSSANPDNPLQTRYNYSGKWWFKWLLRLARSKGVIVKSKQGIFYFGRGLADAEVRYLYSLVKTALYA